MSGEFEAGPPDSGPKQDQNLEGVSILTWTTYDVQTWLKGEGFSYCTAHLAEMNGKNLALAKLKSLEKKLGDQANRASDLWEAVEALLHEQHGEKLLPDKKFRSSMATRGTPVQSAAAPAHDGLQPILESVALEMRALRENVMIQLSNLKLAAQNAAPSRMSDLQFDGLRPTLVYGTYQTPGVEKGSKEEQVIDKISQLLDDARKVKFTGKELSDRKAAIDIFLNNVAKIYNFHAWSDDNENNKLILNDVDPNNPGKTGGYIDLSVSPSGQERPRLLGFEVEKRGSIDKQGNFKKYNISQDNKDQTMGYLEALRRHLPDEIEPCGLVTTLECFYFYRCTGSYQFLESNGITESRTAALFLNDIFMRATSADGKISATSNSRNVLDSDNPKPNSDGRSRDGGASERSFDTSSAAPDTASGRETPGGDFGDTSGSSSTKKASTATSLTKAALMRHNSLLIRRALMLN